MTEERARYTVATTRAGVPSDIYEAVLRAADAHRQTEAELIKAIGEAFPIGRQVEVRRGDAGVMVGTVISHGILVEPNSLVVRSRNGKGHRVHWRNCRLL